MIASATNKDIEDTTKDWSSFAKDKGGGRKERREKKNDQKNASKNASVQMEDDESHIQ